MWDGVREMETDLVSTNNIPVDMNAGKTSPAKIEANRRNAQFSSGPKSPEGKKIVAANARKHGLLEKNIVISTGDGTEDQAEFDSLFFEMRAYYNPVGIAEDLLVQEIATSYWRSARALRCERGEVTIGSTKSTVQPELGQTEELLLELQPESEARHSLLGTSRGLNYLLQKIEETCKEVISSGAVSTESTKWLPRNSRQSWYGFSKQALLVALDKEIAELTTRKVQIEEDEFHERNARRDCS